MNRQELESLSLRGAGIIDSVGEYHWVRVLDEFNMYVMNSDESVTPCLVRDGFWESWVTTWLVNNIKKGDVFYDIGANAGYYSFIAHAYGADVEAFEPNPVYAEMMRKTAQRNKLDNLNVHEVALSNYNGEAILKIPGELHGSATLNALPVGYEDFKGITVPVRSLDELDLSSEGRRVIMKIDAESEEERIIEGAREFLRDSDSVILFEYTPYAYSNNFLDDIFSQWEVTTVDFQGDEPPANKEEIAVSSDWSTLVLRPKS